MIERVLRFTPYKFVKVCSKLGLSGILVFCSGFCLAQSSLSSLEPYNEIADQGGQLRSAYRAIVDGYDNQLLTPSQQRIQNLTVSPLSDQIQILPVPLVLEQREYDRMKKGVEQRAMALRALFEDVVLGEGRIYQEIQDMTAARIDQVFQAEGYSLEFLKAVWRTREISAFAGFYGPDLIRGAEGKWYVLEDNMGNIGGTADLTAVNNLVRAEVGARSHSKSHLQMSVEAFLESHGLTADDPGVLAITYRDAPKGPDWNRPKDIEDERRYQILKEMGFKNLVIADGPSKEEWAGHMQKRWKAVVNIAHPDFGDDYRLSRQYSHDFFGGSSTPFFRSPGASVVGSKYFSVHINKLIAFYLGQRPILKTPETKVVTAQSLRRNPRAWVVKGINGQQGSSVKVLQRATADEIEYMQTLSEDWQAYYELGRGQINFPKWVQQRYVEPSYIPAGVPDSWERFSVDVRPISYMHQGQVLAPTAPWGRAVSKTSAELNNVSRGAFELGVMVVNSCSGQLID
ncbi:MAG: circularly permuted type 2 ATP-grasp protein [Bdellovibrionales bacterium]|nr:circularly permuted type 2 ATP-grasp protein [Bdellovibrionales bacterium]